MTQVCTGSRYTSVVFAAEIKLSDEEIADAQGNRRRAVQNEIAHTGAVVLALQEDTDA